jgi:1,4-dihydroxy-6-naphthoate synthase
LEKPDAQGVVIHEKRFTYAADGLTLLVDLGEHWERETGYPIPLGAIIAKPEAKETLTRQIQESLAWADAHPKDALALCKNYADDMTDAVMQAHIDLYVNDFTRALGPTGEDAVRFFLSRVK